MYIILMVKSLRWIGITDYTILKKCRIFFNNLERVIRDRREKELKTDMLKMKNKASALLIKDDE